MLHREEFEQTSMKSRQTGTVARRHFLLQRLIVSTAVAAVAVSCHTAPPKDGVDLLITGGAVIDPTFGGSSRIADIAIDDGVMVAIGEGLRGKYQATQ
jgi:hypothetical protein